MQDVETASRICFSNELLQRFALPKSPGGRTLESERLSEVERHLLLKRGTISITDSSFQRQVILGVMSLGVLVGGSGAMSSFLNVYAFRRLGGGPIGYLGTVVLTLLSMPLFFVLLGGVWKLAMPG